MAPIWPHHQGRLCLALLAAAIWFPGVAPSMRRLPALAWGPVVAPAVASSSLYRSASSSSGAAFTADAGAATLFAYRNEHRDHP